MPAPTPVDIALLRGFSPLEGLRRQNALALCKKAVVQSIPAGRPLFREGTTDKKTYYLVRGEVELRSGTAVVSRLRADTPDAKNPITPGNPRRFSAFAATQVDSLVFDSDLLDVLLAWDQTGIYDVKELTGEIPVESDDWMTIVLQIKAFQRISPSNLQAIFTRMERMNYRAGEAVIKQGTAGDYFYAITAGRCVVTREYPANPAGMKLAELGPGDSFGEEALISDEKRSATVTMLTDGTLMRLNQADFNSLMNEPLLQYVSFPEAADRVARRGAKWLDVRLPSEFKSARLPEAINLPLCMLRLNLSQLDPMVDYVVVCDTGRRSAAAAFILNARGYNAAVLQGGMPPASLVRG